MSAFRERYGPWALVAGASEGLGEAFARQLAARGLRLLLVARRAGPLEALAAELRAAHGGEVRTAALDLGRPDLLAALEPHLAGLEIGLLVQNAAASALGPFLERPLEEHLAVLDVNCRAPLLLAHRLGREMVRRGRGGILLMSSLAGGQGNGWVVSYAASKAFDTVLAEGLWAELGAAGVDVAACRAGVILTPAYLATGPRGSVPALAPGPVAAAALAALGRGPTAIAGRLNRLVAFVLARLLPRRTAVGIMSRATRRLYTGS